jgi:hypothetical protein
VVDYVPVPVVPELLRAKVRVFEGLPPRRQLGSSTSARASGGGAHRGSRRPTPSWSSASSSARTSASAFAQVLRCEAGEHGQLTGGARRFGNLLLVILGNLLFCANDCRTTLACCGWSMARCRAPTEVPGDKRMLAYARRQELRPETVDVRGWSMA